MQEAIETRVCRLVADCLGIPPHEVQLWSSADNVKNWDSLHIVNLLMALESEFGVKIGVEEAAELLSVQIIIEVLREKGMQ